MVSGRIVINPHFIDIVYVFLFFILACPVFSQKQIMDQSFFNGREYFALRSGQAKMIIQSEQVNVLPAFTYMLFDAEQPAQTRSKENAFNYNAEDGYLSSALEVKLKHHWFTAMGQHTRTGWVTVEGTPSVEAIWWAGGLQVHEVITPLSSDGIFNRNITIQSVNLVDVDTFTMRLRIHEPATSVLENALLVSSENYMLAISVSKKWPSVTDSGRQFIEVGPMVIRPGEQKQLSSLIFLETPPLSGSHQALKSISDVEKNDAVFHIERRKSINKNRISTKDSLVQNMFDASRYILPGLVSDQGKMDAGIFEYGGQWVRDASHTTLGLIHAGEFELARASLRHMLANMITDQGTTMIASGFDAPDREQFDQMGEFMHAMKSYVNWSGDTSLLNEYNQKIITMIERPLNPVFRDSTGMVHNRREFWERTFDDAYELAYQTWVIQGLRDAADLSVYLNAVGKADYWRREADVIKKAMMSHPQMKLVSNGHFIKRRNITGEIAYTVVQKNGRPGSPAMEEAKGQLMPDATLSLPISLGIFEPKSELSVNTLNLLEQLRNQRWTMGGYDRYHTSSQLDQPGPWSFATTFIMRAQHEAGLYQRSRRSLNWLYQHIGGRTGAFYEEIPLVRYQEYHCGFLPWTSGEITYFIVHHLLGFKFRNDQLTIKPALYEETVPLTADLRYRDGRIKLEIRGKGNVESALINGQKLSPDPNGLIVLPEDFKSGTIIIITDDQK